MATTTNESDDEYQDANEFSEPPNIATEAGKANNKKPESNDDENDGKQKKDLDDFLENEIFSVPPESLDAELEQQSTTIPNEGDENNCGEEEDDEEALRKLEENMTEEELQKNKEKAAELKLKGNDCFKNNEDAAAIECYTEALQICPTSCKKERAVLYGNRAAAKIKINSNKSAIDDCNKALELWPEYVRALLRRAKLFETEDKLDEALADYKRALELDPGLSEAREALVRLPPIINERNERLKEEMISKLKDLGNMVLKPFGLSTSNFQMQQDPNTGSYSINFSQNQK